MVNAKRGLAKLLFLMLALLGIVAVDLYTVYGSNDYALAMGSNPLRQYAICAIGVFGAAALISLFGKRLSVAFTGVLYVIALALMLNDYFSFVHQFDLPIKITVQGAGAEITMLMAVLCLVPGFGLLVSMAGKNKASDVVCAVLTLALTAGAVVYAVRMTQSFVPMLPALLTSFVVILMPALDGSGKAPKWLYFVLALAVVAAAGVIIALRIRDIGFSAMLARYTGAGDAFVESARKALGEAKLFGPSEASVGGVYLGNAFAVNRSNMLMGALFNTGIIPTALRVACSLIVVIILFIIGKDVNDSTSRSVIMSIASYVLFAHIVGYGVNALMAGSMYIPFSGAFANLAPEIVMVALATSLYASDDKKRIKLAEKAEK